LDFPNFQFTNAIQETFTHLLDSSVQVVDVALPTRHLSTLFEEADGCHSFADIICQTTNKFSNDQRLHRATTAAQQAFSEGKSLNENAIQTMGKQFASDPINTLAAAIQVVKPRCLQVRGLNNFHTDVPPNDLVMLHQMATDGVPIPPDP
jgi:hypothetical protein